MHILKPKLISINIEIILYKTLVRPCITYGAEFRTLTAKDVRAPRIFLNENTKKMLWPNERWRGLGS